MVAFVVLIVILLGSRLSGSVPVARALSFPLDCLWLYHFHLSILATLRLFLICHCLFVLLFQSPLQSKGIFTVGITFQKRSKLSEEALLPPILFILSRTALGCYSLRRELISFVILLHTIRPFSCESSIGTLSLFPHLSPHILISSLMS